MERIPLRRKLALRSAHFCYGGILSGYWLCALLTAPFHKKARGWISGRWKWRQVLQKEITAQERWIWFHASSLGEYEDSISFFREVMRLYPSHKTILTFFSPSGHIVLQNSKEFDVVTYLPLDFRRNARDFLDRVQPEAVFFSRSELWYNFLRMARLRSIPIVLVGLRMNASSNFIKKRTQLWYAECFKSFTGILCQDHQTRDLLERYFNVTTAKVVGNFRLTSVVETAYTIDFQVIQQFRRGYFTIVAGSVLKKDLELIVSQIRRFAKEEIRWIIVPHEPDSVEEWTVLNQCGCGVMRYSNIGEIAFDEKIIYVDTVGILKHLYAYADLAFVGGGFNKIGIHNILEPAVYGVPVVFGPNHRNYTEALDLLALGGAHVVHSSEDLARVIQDAFNGVSSDVRGDIKTYVQDTCPKEDIIRKYVTELRTLDHQNR